MNSFTTKISKHCFFGNLTNILNYYGETVSEAELVLLSDALNCDYKFNTKNFFFGISNESCQQGLKKIGYNIIEIKNDYTEIKYLLTNDILVLLVINSGILTYNNIFKGTNRDHYIVLLKDHVKTIEISDSFLQTNPISYFQGDIDLILIKNEIQKMNTIGLYIEKNKNTNNQIFLKDKFYEYIKVNALFPEKSIIGKMQSLCNDAFDNFILLFNNEFLNNLSYNIKVGGVIARYDYLIELIRKYLIDYSISIEILTILKNEWTLIAAKIMKCSMTLNKDYYKKLFEIEIPFLVNKELKYYQELFTFLESKGVYGD